MQDERNMQPQHTSVTVELNSAGSRYFDLIAVLFVAVYLISQVSSAKLIQLGPFQFPGAIIVFPIAYIFGDILTEVYGYSRTRRVIWAGFASAVLLSVVLWIVQILPASTSWTNQVAYEAILGVVPRVVVGSILAYWAGEFVNSFILAKMKIWTGGRHLWSRTIGSTVVGQAADSLVFASIAFYGVVPLNVLFSIVGSLYLFKVLYEVIATPITYVIVGWLKRTEGIDVYDRGTNFTPFKL
jgi:queuosine precursor transporter